ncbi:hypothetical protein HK098_001487 [Nowakowskiella sp. JEL0407]|nr:hypothetical protein HK098_001487 [Nowakowskiella sp. JEL0407]
MEKKVIPGTVAPIIPPPIPLPLHLGLETAAALISAATISPFISIFDKAIFTNASGKEKLFPAVKRGFSQLLTQPSVFVRQPAFLVVFGLYSGTYIVANFTQTICDHSLIPWFYPKFITTTAVNVSLSLLKDLYFTRAFGTTAVRAIPLASSLLYTTRDSMTIFASFNLPGIFSNSFQQSPYHLSESWSNFAAQLMAPMSVQVLSSPLHLLGMDLYNRPSGTNRFPKLRWSDRFAFIRKEYIGTTLARWGRIFPAYSIGGVLNNAIRQRGKKILEGYNNLPDKIIKELK